MATKANKGKKTVSKSSNLKCEFCSKRFGSSTARAAHSILCIKNPERNYNLKKRNRSRLANKAKRDKRINNMSPEKKRMISDAMGMGLDPSPSNGDIYIKFCPCCGFSMDRITITEVV